MVILFQENSPIHADEVRSLDNDLVGTINPRSPSVNVSDFSLHTDRTNHASHIIDAGGESVGVAVLPVQIFTADRNGKNPILAMGRDGVEQSLLLSLEVVDIFGPDTDEDLGAGVEGGGNGIGEGVAVRTGVEADGCDVLRETLQLVECCGPLGGGLAGSIGVVGSNIESLPVSRGQRQRCRQSSDRSRETHLQRCVLKRSKDNVDTKWKKRSKEARDKKCQVVEVTRKANIRFQLLLPKESS